MDNIVTITDDLGKPGRESRPEWIAVKSFGLAIMVGAVFLMLPVSSHDGTWIGPIDA